MSSVTELIETIEKSLIELAELIDEDYIMAAFVSNSIMIDSRVKKDKSQTLTYYKNLEANNE